MSKADGEESRAAGGKKERDAREPYVAGDYLHWSVVMEPDIISEGWLSPRWLLVVT